MPELANLDEEDRKAILQCWLDGYAAADMEDRLSPGNVSQECMVQFAKSLGLDTTKLEEAWDEFVRIAEQSCKGGVVKSIPAKIGKTYTRPPFSISDEE